MNTGPVAQNRKSRSLGITRRFLRPRYGLRTLLVLVTLVAVLFGYESYVSWKERRAARAIEALGGNVYYTSIAPEWLQNVAGEDYLQRADVVTFDMVIPENAIRHCGTFGSLRNVTLYVPDLYSPRDPPPPDLISTYSALEQSASKFAKAFPDLEEMHVREEVFPFGYDEGSRQGVLRQLRDTCQRSGAKGRTAIAALRRTETWPRIYGLLMIVPAGRGEFAVLALLEPESEDAAPREKIACLLQGGFVVDVLDWSIDETRDEWVFFDEDYRLGIGFMPAGAPSIRSHRPDNPRWIEAYEFTPTGFVPLVEKKSQPASNQP